MPYSVYVILLDDGAHCAGSGGLGSVYVGETALDPRDRLRKHLAGDRTAARVVTEHGIGLVSSLYEHLNPIETRAGAEAAEAQLRADLMAAGWRVCGGTRGMSQAEF